MALYLTLREVSLPSQMGFDYEVLFKREPFTFSFPAAPFLRDLGKVLYPKVRDFKL